MAPDEVSNGHDPQDTPDSEVMTVSLTPDPSPARAGEGRFVSRSRDFHGQGAIVVVDYGMGNLRSVWQALVHVADGRQVIVSADPAVLAAAERVVFPGQGAMPDCMREIEVRGLRAAVLDAARNKPFLGICIGQQMLFEHSEEGNVPGPVSYTHLDVYKRQPLSRWVTTAPGRTTFCRLPAARASRHRSGCTTSRSGPA